MSDTKASDLTGSPPDRRKLIAVLHMDMVGYSRLIGLDDVGTLQRLRALRRDLIDPAIEEHGGRLVNTGGDSLLLVFDSAEGAVRCAIKVQQQVPIYNGDQPTDRAIRFRVGIHVGDVIADGTDVHEDVVNVAARLQAECPPGGVCVSRAVRDHVRDRLDLAFAELGALDLKNIVRPVEAFVLKLDVAGVIQKSVEQSLLPRDHEVLPLPDRPSIAVLAFTNMSGDIDQEYFSDGIADDIITSLSRIRWLFVIARNSSFTYKGNAVDVKQVGRELGVRYVVEGSVRRSADRLRITAQLIEAPTGGHVWAERFDRRIADIFTIQDEIAEAVVNAIEPAMAKAERQRVGRKEPENFDTWEHYHRGLWHFFKFTTPDSRLALEFLHRAAALDPGSASVQAGLGLNYLVSGWLFAPQEHPKWRVLGLEHGRIAAGLDPLDAMAHAVFGLGLFLSGEHEAAGEETAQAVSLNPSNTTVQGLHGCVLGYSGRSENALPHFRQAIRLSPMDTLRWFWVHSSANALYFSGDYNSCAAAGRDVRHMRPDLVYGYRAIVAALAELGRIEEAHQYADLIYTRFNSEVREFLTSRWPEWREADYAAYVASLAKGGLILRGGMLTRIN